MSSRSWRHANTGLLLVLAALATASCHRVGAPASTRGTPASKAELLLQTKGGWVKSVAFSSTGRSLAVGADDGAVSLWDAESGTRITTLGDSVGLLRFPGRPKAAGVSALAISPDESLLIGGTTTGEVRVWEARTRRLRHVLLGHRTGVSAVAISPNGRTTASGDTKGVVRLWNARTGAKGRTQDLSAHGAVGVVAFSPDGSRLVTGGQDGTLTVWDLPTGAPRERAGLPRGLERRAPSPPVRGARARGTPVTEIAFSPDSQAIAYSIENNQDSGVLLVRDLGTDRIRWQRTERVRRIAFSPDRRHVATDSAGGRVQLWDARSGARLWASSTLRLPEIAALSYTRDGRLQAVSSFAQSVGLWVMPFRLRRVIRTSERRSVASVAFSPDGRVLASAVHTVARLWDVASGRSVRALVGHRGGLFMVAFSPDGRRLATGGNDGTVRLWAASTGTLLWTGRSETAVTSVAFSPDGARLLSSGSVEGARLWEVSTGRLLRRLGGPGADVTAVAFSPDGRLAAIGDRTGHGSLWEIGSGAGVRRLPAQAYPIDALGFTVDGRRLVSHDTSGLARVWEVPGGRNRGDYAGSGTLLGGPSFALSRDGRWLLTAGATLRLWDLSGGMLSRELGMGFEAPAHAIAFAPDDRSFATGDADGAVRIWGM